MVRRGASNGQFATILGAPCTTLFALRTMPFGSIATQPECASAIRAPSRLLCDTRARAQTKPVPKPELLDLTLFSGTGRGTGTNDGRNL